VTRYLKPGETCPLHRSVLCCGRRGNRPSKTPGIRIIMDPHHPRGFRELHSPAVLRNRKHFLLSIKPVCEGCGASFLEDKTPYDQIELWHIEPKGVGGARRDDHPSNTALGHKKCNRDNGSKRPTVKQLGQFRQPA
jgi:hypothetical protein